MAARRRALFISLSVLGLFLFGTVVVLSSITYYLAIDPSAYLTELEVPILDSKARWNASEHGQVERIPRILHQTWRTETLPLRWKGISQECRDMMPDYEYMLWTDESSRNFIAEHYGWFLDTFIDYKYAIQRADAIRYFVLYHYGGVYLDLDIGCLRPLDPLLVYPVILPKTIPVGVSNDLMFAEKGHPFLAQTIHNLVTFDHNWILNYPTVMFSTGPMFLSAQYGIFTSSHASLPSDPVRILPKSLYGKNAKEGEAPHTFFTHFYGSSWHADDAAFIGFLGTWGKGLMWIGLIVLIGGVVWVMLPTKRRRGLRRMGGYDVLFPRGRLHLHLGRSGTSSDYSEPSTTPSSPDGSMPNSPSDDSDVPVLHLPFSVRTTSPALSEQPISEDQFAGRAESPIVAAFRRVRNRVASTISGTYEEPPRTPARPRRRSHSHNSRGVLFFLPAIFTQSHDIETGSSSTSSYPRSSTPALPLLPRSNPKTTVATSRFTEVDHDRDLLEHEPLIDDLESVGVSNSRSTSPHPGSQHRAEASVHLIDFGAHSPPSTPPFPRTRSASRVGLSES